MTSQPRDLDESCEGRSRLVMERELEKERNLSWQDRRRAGREVA